MELRRRMLTKSAEMRTFALIQTRAPPTGILFNLSFPVTVQSLITDHALLGDDGRQTRPLFHALTQVQNEHVYCDHRLLRSPAFVLAQPVPDDRQLLASQPSTLCPLMQCLPLLKYVRGCARFPVVASFDNRSGRHMRSANHGAIAGRSELTRQTLHSGQRP